MPRSQKSRDRVAPAVSPHSAWNGWSPAQVSARYRRRLIYRSGDDIAAIFIDRKVESKQFMASVCREYYACSIHVSYQNRMCLEQHANVFVRRLR
jgi:hypothetical protein